MSLSLYETSIPVFLHGLRQLSHLLDKAQAHAQASGIDPARLIGARLAADMLPLTAQVQRASDTSKLSAQRLSGVAAPKMEDDESTFDQLRARIAATVAYLQSLAPAQVDGNETATITLSTGRLKAVFDAKGYLLQFALPNFFFHVATAHAILRQQGVAIGKLDYLGRIGTPVGT